LYFCDGSPIIKANSISKEKYMKRLSIIVVTMAMVTALAIVAIGCDSPAQGLIPDEARLRQGVFYENGVAFKEISIGLDTASTRALTTDLAKAAVDYYEVVFAVNTSATTTPAWEYYRAAAKITDPLRIAIPVATYAVDGTVVDYGTTAGGEKYTIMLAGAYNNGSPVLLATGKLTGQTAGATVETAGTVSGSTTAMVYTLTPLLAHANGAGTDPVTVANEPDNGFAIVKVGAADTSVATTAGTPSGKITDAASRTVPYFKVPKQSAALGTGAANDITASINITNYPTYNVVPATPVAKLGSVGLAVNADPAVLVAQGSVAPAIATAAATAAPLPPIGTVTLTFVTPNTGVTQGFSKIWFNIPVCVGAAASTNQVWNVRGGIDNYYLDENTIANNPSGGAILLAVGVTQEGAITITSTF
jgi:hypothetical protein